MRPRGIARGEGRIGCLFWSLLGLIFVLVAIKAVPVKIASMKLEDYMTELAMSQRARVAGHDFFEREIFNKARDLELDIPRKQIHAKKYPERVVMDVEFTVPIDLLAFTYDWNIAIHVDRDVFWI
jgi:hypothetical protein